MAFLKQVWNSSSKLLTAVAAPILPLEPQENDSPIPMHQVPVNGLIMILSCKTHLQGPVNGFVMILRFYG